SSPLWLRLALVAVALGLTYIVEQARHGGHLSDLSGVALVVAVVLVVAGALFLLPRVGLPGGDDGKNARNGGPGVSPPSSTVPPTQSTKPPPAPGSVPLMPLLTADGGTGFDLLEYEPATVNGVERNDGISFGACFGSYN